MSNSNSLEDKRRMDNKIRAGCCGCFLGVFVLFYIFYIVAIVIPSNAVYQGKDNYITAEQLKRETDNQINMLGHFGVILDSENRMSNNLDDVIKKVSENDRYRLIDKVHAMSAYGDFTSVYYVEEDQAVISEYVRILKEDVESGLLDESINDEQFILKRAYMTAVVQNAIPTKERNENLGNIRGFTVNYYQFLKAYASNDGDKVQSKFDQLNKVVDEIEVPVI